MAMPPSTSDDDTAAEIARLRDMLAASKRMGPGYRDRIAAIEAKLKELGA